MDINSIKIAVEVLKSEIEDLKKKLKEKQDHINKTNAYYKKKIYHIKKGS